MNSRESTSNEINQWDFIEGFHTALKPNSRPSTTTEAAEITLTARVPFVVLVPDFEEDGETPLSIVISDESLIAQASFMKELGNSHIDPIMIAVEDDQGLLSYSTVFLRIISKKPTEMPLERACKVNDEYSVEAIQELAVRMVKKFAEAYKYAWSLEAYKYPEEQQDSVRKHWLPEIDIRKIAPLQDITVLDSEGNKLYQLGYLGGLGTGVGLGTDLKQDTLKILQEACISEIRPNALTYLSLAKRYFHNGEFEAFCIMLTNVYEKRVFELLKIKLLNKGKTEEEIASAIFTNRLRKDGKSKEKIGIWKAVRVICDGKSYQEDASYIVLERDLLSIRDQIIHGDPIRIDKEAAFKMGQAYSAFIRYLEQQI